MSYRSVIASGDWKNVDHMVDYRSEWLSDMLVERATWAPETPTARVDESVVRAPGYVWLRFWLNEEEQVVEKYFDDQGNSIGVYVPICMPPKRKGKQIATDSLTLALWIVPAGRVSVLHEHAFERLAEDGTIGPVEVEQAEFCIRKLTAAIAQERFPPAMVRNFAIQVNIK